MQSLRFVIIIFTQLTIISLLVYLVQLLIPKLRNCTKNGFRSFKQKMMWNGLLRSNSLAYIVFCIAFTFNLRYYFFDNEEASTGHIITSVVSGLFMIGSPLIVMAIIYKHRDNLEDQKVKDKFSVLYEGMSMKTLKTKMWYWPTFMLRRVEFVIVPIIFQGQPVFQTQLLFLTTTIYLVSYMKLKPHVEKRRRYLEIFNEVGITIQNYHLFMFADDQIVEARHQVGVSYIAVIIIIIIVNVLVVVHSKFHRCKLRKWKKLMQWKNVKQE